MSREGARSDEAGGEGAGAVFNRQIVDLDTLSTKIRARSGKCVKRAEIIRGVLDAIEQHGPDQSTATSEEQVKELVAAALK